MLLCKTGPVRTTHSSGIQLGHPEEGPRQTSWQGLVSLGEVDANVIQLLPEILEVILQEMGTLYVV